MDFAGVQVIARGDDFEFPGLHRSWVGKDDVERHLGGARRRLVGGLERLSGSYAYSALATVVAGGRRDWISIASSGGRGPNLKELAYRVTIAPDFLANVRALITPGTTLVLTDTPVNARTRTARGFNILTD